mmetsp:Transcript_14545/g.34474  ORF Transcript_14545/g.34474 Transcript_14545/m.34474 type:complete len:281 (+) Transcript_14545:138-980(+)|eukprot:CAMPEP_0177720846 /NCGR_PEP_ID=MMETSP0484_2-20121128/16832_1 /TAXON_ID=354590 /ORGANISM="Rhodomonas lens, Strain RHODO" /LENGTH=280 /DNA_ID=CAMNT_0019233113 /DNA_START=130 /DNA_END=972 /DNA_ORIENTATION=+
MRLRAVLERHKRLGELVRVLEKLGKTAHVLLSPKLCTIAVNPDNTSQPQAWASLATNSDDGSSVFRTYRIESKNDDKIAFEIDLSNFSRALKSSEQAEMATVKLAKKFGKAFLSFEIIIQSTPMMTVIQDIPISMISAEEQQILEEPDIGEPSVRLIAPPLKSLSNVADRLKGLHDRICLRANMAGELEVGVETEFVFMNNFWKDLDAPALDGQPPPPKDPSQKASVVVDGAVLGRVLSSFQLRPNVSIICIVDRMGHKILVWHLFLGEDTVTYYLPVLE